MPIFYRAAAFCVICAAAIFLFPRMIRPGMDAATSPGNFGIVLAQAKCG